jgi:1-acyl-sn-glycerol-3-phosphate acyltransferase
LASEGVAASEGLAPAERKAHAYARERGVSRPLYAFVRFLAVAVLRLWFRVRITGAEHIPAEGAAIVAPNHKNFLDAFFVGIATRRHVRYMAKVELFRGPLAWLFPRLGAFPVRSGVGDAEALETARTILAAGGLVVVFPEGTRVEAMDALGSPRHGAGRLALEPAPRSCRLRSLAPRICGAAPCQGSGGCRSRSSPRLCPRRCRLVKTSSRS